MGDGSIGGAACCRRTVILILTLLITGACRSESKSGPKPLMIGWRPIESWSGHGSTQTDSFDIGSGQFRIKWQCTNETKTGAGSLRVEVHSGVSGRPIALAIDHHGVGKDIAYVNDDPRPYYLVIESSNVDWRLAVEEAVVSATP